MTEHSDEARAWLRAYSGSIDATALLLAFDAGRAAVRAEVEAERAVIESEQFRVIVTHPEHGRIDLWGGAHVSEEACWMAYRAHLDLGTDPVVERRVTRTVIEEGPWIPASPAVEGAEG